MKKHISLFLTFVLSIALATTSVGAQEFTDMNDATYADAIETMSTLGVIGGYEDGSFAPTATLTRGAATKIICNLLLGVPSANGLKANEAPFSDVAVDHTFAAYIQHCADKGIVGGYEDGTFRPANTVTTYEFSKMLLGVLGYDSIAEGYTGSNWSINVAKQSLTIGLDIGNEKFSSNEIVTREQACLYAQNAISATMVTYESSACTEVTNTTETDGIVQNDGLMQLGELHIQKSPAEEEIWEKIVTGNKLYYSGTVEGILYDAPPTFRPTLEVDGLGLISIGHDMRNYTASWIYQGTTGSIDLRSANPSNTGIARNMDDATIIENAQTLTIDGNTATYYENAKFGLLVWENEDNQLFFLEGKNISKELLVEIAQSIKPITGTVDAHDLDWMPSGYSLIEWYEIADTVQEYWVKDNVTLSWMYSMDALGTPDWDSTTVEVNGVDAQYWEVQDTYYTDNTSGDTESTSGDNQSIPGISITSYTKPAQREMNTLAWQDPDTGVHYRLQSILPQDEMLRMANSVD